MSLYPYYNMAETQGRLMTNENLELEVFKIKKSIYEEDKNKKRKGSGDFWIKSQ